MKWYNEIDFVDIVAVLFGMTLLGAMLVAYFMGMAIDADFKSWFFAILTFFIGKKAMPTTINPGFNGANKFLVDKSYERGKGK